MRLLTEIIELLSSDSPNLENALFKAQVLAHRLGETEMKEWVSHELKGYPQQDTIPPYRILPIIVKANLTNGITRYNDHAIPMMGVDARVREKLCTRRISESIAAVAEWAKPESNIAIHIGAEYYNFLQAGIANDYQIESAWGKHTVGAMTQIVTEVRSRLLDFALQVSDRIPQEIQSDNIKEFSQEAKVSEIFRNAVFGSNATIIVGSGSIQGVTNNVVANDLESLISVLHTSGIQDRDLEDLRKAISADSENSHIEKPGPEVRNWIATMISKAGSAAWEISLTSAGTVLGAAISAYYGIGIN